MQKVVANTNETLAVALLQSELVWQNPKANRANFAKQIAHLGQVDVIVLPEMFTTGFAMQSAEENEADFASLNWLKQQAKSANAAIVGSVAARLEQGWVNRCYFVTPSGEAHFYDKKHLFRMGQEPNFYIAGNERVVVTWRGWRFLLQVCYDLRFPVFSRNRNDYDVALYVANWPEARRHAWRTLLQARAIENQAFVLGCNCVGRDGNGLHYSGDSLIVDYKGQIVAEQEKAEPTILRYTLNYAQLLQFKQKFPAYLDADVFELI